MFFDSDAHTDFLEEILESLLDRIKSQEPKYNVVLLDDNDHTYDYVIEMLGDIFGYSFRKAFEMACEVDYTGRVVVYTASKKEAEEKRNHILNYGPDWRLSRSKGSMRAILEKVS